MEDRLFQAGQIVKYIGDRYDDLIEPNSLHTVTDPYEYYGGWCFAIKGHGEYRFFEDEFELYTQATDLDVMFDGIRDAVKGVELVIVEVSIKVIQ